MRITTVSDGSNNTLSFLVTKHIFNNFCIDKIAQIMYNIESIICGMLRDTYLEANNYV